MPGNLKDLNFDILQLESIPEFKGNRNFFSIYELLLNQLTHAMNIGISDILVSALRKHPEIAQYRDQEKYPPGKNRMIALLEYTVVSKHAPIVQLVLNNVPTGKLKFDILLKLNMKGSRLTIRDGKILEILPGVCIGSGSLEYEGFPLLERKESPFELPESIHFEGGISI